VSAYGSNVLTRSIRSTKDGEIPFWVGFDFGTPTVEIKLFVLPVSTVLPVPDAVDAHFWKPDDAEQDGEVIEEFGCLRP
jgi:hypothetical protein